MTKQYDLEQRLLEYASAIIGIVELIPSTNAGRHISQQLLRSGTSPYANHGEAQSAESPKDFIHKMKICLKELRETYRWLRLIDKTRMVQTDETVNSLIEETDELIRIFYSSIKTARKNTGRTLEC